MTPWHAALLVLAGIGAGLTGSVAGLASLISYPALLAVGLPPVTANVTNTIALVFSTIGSFVGSRPELEGQGPQVRTLGGVGIAGGVVGGVLLLSTPAVWFERIVPWLIGFGSLTILLPRRAAEVHTRDSPLFLAGVFAIGLYAGYFGAAAGVLMLALFLAVSSQTLARCNALKNIVVGLANAVAAVVFVVFGTVSWASAVPLAIGLYVGGRVGPAVVRHSPAPLLRVLIAISGVAMAIYLGYKTYL